MHHLAARFHAFFSSWQHVGSETLLAILLVIFIVVTPAGAAMRFQERSLFMNNATPGAISSYTVSFRYMSPQPVGSVDMLFCNDPIPYHPCVAPTGMDVSGAVLSAQTGETGFSITTRSANHLVLSRAPGMVAGVGASYTFTGIKNPTDTSQAFSIRLRSHASTNASGPQIDFGSVRGQATTPITIETQVPPMLIFCAAGEVAENCVTTNENYYTDMGELSHRSTLTAQSQMAVGTNASGGFAITANGNPMSAGTNVIDGMRTPTASKKGDNQFGINLVANNSPTVGHNPEGLWANAVAANGYNVPNKYKYISGDVVAYSPNVSLMKKFTVSYVVNTDENLRPGVYTTTITYIASGRF